MNNATVMEGKNANNSTGKPDVFENVEELVESIISKIGNDIRMGLPIGVGKPTIIANEIYRRAKNDPNLKLKIFSGLSLETPKGKVELEKRFLGPLVKRLFPDYPDPEFTMDSHAGKLPENVEISDFYITPGAYIGNPYVQQGYISSNYSHVPRDVIDAGVNVAASMICKGDVNGQTRYSLSSNADAPLDTTWELLKLRESGYKVAILGQMNQNLPFMFGTAVCEPETFDAVLDHPSHYHQLFGPPREAVLDQDYGIGMNASALIRDGGSIQIGIGSLGDALTYGLKARHTDNDLYKKFMSGMGITDKFGDTIERIGGLAPFEEGLYGITELMIDGFIQLKNCGVLKRRVFDNIGLQRLINEKKISETVTPKTLEIMVEEGVVNPQLTEQDFQFLREFGVFKQCASYRNGIIFNGGKEGIQADLNNPRALDYILKHCLGDRLKHGVLVHASFFIGPQSFYDSLADMNEEDRAEIQMREISFCNQLYGGEDLKLLQRKNARFVNVALMQTLLGSTVSDGLENGQVVSGVGGQYNFVAMAHALPGGRSIILVRAATVRNGEAISNILWNYGHCTIPRHLRDLVVTEYGIAELRGKPDHQVIKALLNVADSRFQQKLLQKAKDNGKIQKDYRIPQMFRNNTPERLAHDLKPYRDKGMFEPFPFGSQLTEEERVLGKALLKLKSLKSAKAKDIPGLLPSMGDLRRIMTPPAAARPYLERMGLDKPANFDETKMQKLVLWGLTRTGAV